MAWSGLEADLGTLLELLVPLDDAAVSQTVLANIEFRSLIQMVLVLGFLKKPSSSGSTPK